MFSRAGTCNQLTVLKSAAGYYIGSVDKHGMPNCRVSTYYKTKEAAEEDLKKKTFVDRDCIEGCDFCEFAD